MLERFLARHPYLAAFAVSPTCAIVRVKLSSYQMINRFQQAVEWRHPSVGPDAACGSGTLAATLATDTPRAPASETHLKPWPESRTSPASTAPHRRPAETLVTPRNRCAGMAHGRIRREAAVPRNRRIPPTARVQGHPAPRATGPRRIQESELLVHDCDTVPIAR